MKVMEIGIRRRHLAALTLMPAPKEIKGAEYEGDKLLIDREILERCNIKKGSELSLEDVRELVLVSESYRAKQRALWYLSRSDISEKSLYNKLRRGFSEKASAFATEQMVKRGYLDDRRFAENLSRSLSEHNISANAAVGKMLEKGLEMELIKDVLKGYKDHDTNRIVNLLGTKYKNKMGDEAAIQKTIAALARRGFSFDNIKEAIRIISSKEY